MGSTVDKLVIANGTALAAKYGAVGLADVQAALARLIAADHAAGLATQVRFIDDAAAMAAIGGHAVSAATDERGAKAAVDAAFLAMTPDYIMLLDGPDVIPHVTLNAVPGLTDGDATIPSDLPYACNAGWSRTASRFQAVTRVVSRLPAPEGAKQAAGLVAAIDRVIAHRPRPATAFSPPFVLSADAWQASTATSASTVFGPGTAVERAPPAAHTAIDAGLRRLAHFINCHGAKADDAFYGDNGSATPLATPMAMRSGNLAPLVAPGVIVAAECCYGAELYDAATLGIGQPMCMAYLDGGAAAYLGSTTISYGPASGTGQADVIAQDFMRHVLTGASIGRAFLQARQDFVRTQAMSSPANLKTLAQFVLFGDPACQPCLPPAIPGDAAPDDAGTDDPAMRRKARRLRLEGAGRALADAATRIAGPATLAPELLARVRGIAEGRGIATDALTVLEVGGGAAYRAAAKLLDGSRQVAIAVDPRPRFEGRPGPSVRLLIAHIMDGRILRVEEAESRSCQPSRSTSPGG